MKRLTEKIQFQELQLNDRLVRVHKGEVQHYSYVCPHPFGSKYAMHNFVALHGNSATEVSMLTTSVHDKDIWFKVEDIIDRDVIRETLLEQINLMSETVKNVYRVRKR